MLFVCYACVLRGNLKDIMYGSLVECPLLLLVLILLSINTRFVDFVHHMYMV